MHSVVVVVVIFLKYVGIENKTMILRIGAMGVCSTVPDCHLAMSVTSALLTGFHALAWVVLFGENL